MKFLITGEKIAAFRKKKNLSQRDFGQILGVSHRTIQNYEKGEKIPDSKLALLKKILTSDQEPPETKIQNKLFNELSKFSVDEISTYIIYKRSDFLESPVFKMIIENQASKIAIKMVKNL